MSKRPTVDSIVSAPTRRHVSAAAGAAVVDVVGAAVSTGAAVVDVVGAAVVEASAVGSPSVDVEHPPTNATNNPTNASLCICASRKRHTLPFNRLTVSIHLG
jgi:hypothetical protein